MREASNPLDEPADDEANLLAGLRAGRDEAYRELVHRYGGRLLAVARRIVRSEDEALDALQDALVQAFRNLDGFAAQSRLSTWLHRITVNAALMRIRRRRSRPEEPIEPLLPVFLEDGHAAVEEQGSATQEISGNVQMAARGTEELTQNVTGVTGAIQETSRSAENVLSASGKLALHSNALKDEVDYFLREVAAA